MKAWHVSFHDYIHLVNSLHTSSIQNNHIKVLVKSKNYVIFTTKWRQKFVMTFLDEVFLDFSIDSNAIILLSIVIM